MDRKEGDELADHLFIQSNLEQETVPGGVISRSGEQLSITGLEKI